MTHIKRNTLNIYDSPRLTNCVLPTFLFLIQIVNDLLTFEKIEAGMMMLTKSRTPLVEFLKTNAKLQFLPALSKQIDITIFPPPDCEDIYVDIDPVKLGLVFGNLLSNAVKFTPAHGRIDVSISVNKSIDGGKKDESQ